MCISSVVMVVATGLLIRVAGGGGLIETVSVLNSLLARKRDCHPRNRSLIPGQSGPSWALCQQTQASNMLN